MVSSSSTSSHVRAQCSANQQGDQAMWLRELIAYPLGPKLGQCCGGMVRVLIERFTCHEIDALHSINPCTSDSSTVGDGLFVRRTKPGQPISWCHARQASSRLSATRRQPHQWDVERRKARRSCPCWPTWQRPGLFSRASIPTENAALHIWRRPCRARHRQDCGRSPVRDPLGRHP